MPLALLTAFYPKSYALSFKSRALSVACDVLSDISFLAFEA